ncbi:ribosomal protein S18-alanine N-acetyltransferase [Tateyamaria omphalii]|uniref:[Ribosomal protein bS18]-alanine N-acetyltransferase n=1 Tax=Tateyamaria omphalii TaxID=299262 RepID=A0A1P8MR66_9RHOB|nr:ribosomal protein S18-alanine N-acetyltransferase [Tateyamaria omphalii]APX10469.1 ribosomal-protein-alanine N-acetyltransferase [Tateyamaria omphalii]
MTPDALAALHAAAFTQERPWTAAEFSDLLANPLTHLETAANGFALWRGIAEEAELLTIAVHPAAQARGIGARLMAAWMRSAAENCTEAFLEVAADNAAAIHLYARYGFETAAKRTGYYRRPDTRADALIMRARLPFSVSEKSTGARLP